MPAFTTTLLLSLLLASAPDTIQPGRAAARESPTQWAQLAIEQRVIIRIPTMRSGQRSSLMREGDETPPPALILKEVKGPKCLQLSRLRGASINPENGITINMVAHGQFRAHFNKACRPADFYGGFYIEPNEDGALCAGRDTLHARSGSTCGIVKFSRLVPDEVANREK